MSAEPVTAYAEAVAAGTIPAGKFHRLACTRHLADLTASAGGSLPYVYNPKLADRAFRLFRLFRHYKGSEFAGRPIELEPWQRFIVGSLMGWVDDRGHRRFKNAFNEMPRGNGKSTIAGGLLVSLTFFHGESGAEGYSIATKKDQARISFQAGRQMLLRSAALKSHVTIGKHHIHQESTESKMLPLGADADTLDGLRPYVVVADEIHKFPSAEIIDVMESGMGTRPDPLLFEITTAGVLEGETVYRQHYELTTRILEGVIPLEEWFGFIAAADPADDWTREGTWEKANPNYRVSIKPEFLKKELKKALANPAEQPKFRRLYLGQHVQTLESFFSASEWAACPALPPEAELLSLPCWIGLDLSSSVDITAAVLVWPLAGEEWAVRPIFWLPAEGLEDRGHRDRLPYARWASDRLPGRSDPILRLTEGTTINFRRVRQDIAELAHTWHARAVAADPWQMRELGPALEQGDHVPVILVPQTFALLSQPMKAAQGKILERKIRHDHNPLMRVMVANVTPRRDEKDNVLPSKKRSRGRIDGVSALLNAVSQLPVREPAAPWSLFFLGGQ